MILTLAAAAFLSAPLTAMNADPSLGDATRNNLAAMIVPPTRSNGTIEGDDGVRGVAAIRRYHTDKVKMPVRSAITTVGAAGQ